MYLKQTSKRARLCFRLNGKGQPAPRRRPFLSPGANPGIPSRDAALDRAR
jgi:hypothetical protein